MIRGQGGKYSRRGTPGTGSTTRRRQGNGSVNNNQNNQQQPQQHQHHQKEKKEKDSEFETTFKLNSEVCRRMDNKFEKLIKVAAQVALYEYDCDSSTYKQCNTRGSLFLYKRVVEPFIGLFILNRNSLENFALLVTPQIEMQLVKPYIMMKTTEAIGCLWFYKEEDCVEIANIISKKVGISLQTEGQVVKKESPIKPNSEQKSGSDTSKPQGGGGGGASAAIGGFFVPGNEGRHILSLLCNNRVPTVEKVPEEEVVAQVLDKILDKNSSSSSCQNVRPGQKALTQPELDSLVQNVRPGQKGLTQPELDSLGAELRATLGIINDPRTILNESLLTSDPTMMFLHDDKSDQEPVTEDSTFLSMEQMLKATVYLLKTEKGFAGKLEAAYINSLSDC